jgi:hypothetical protein
MNGNSFGFEKEHVCSKTDQKCLDTPLSNISEIKNWWQEMSVKKAMKCKMPTIWKRESPRLSFFNKQIPVKSYPCRPGELSIIKLQKSCRIIVMSYSQFLN